MLKIIKRILLLCVFLAVAGGVYGSVRHDFPVRIPIEWRSVAKSLDALHPARDVPDNIVLTPAPDMATGMRMAWRTSPAVQDGVVQYEKAEGGTRLEARAAAEILHSPVLASDADVRCFSILLENLEPGTAYRYRVGSVERQAWSDYGTFTTAPAGKGEGSFSFVYFGDTQVYPDRFAKMLALVEEKHPDAAFHMIAGDLVDWGDDSNLWDDLFANTGNVWANRPLAPAMGNHDYNRFGLGPEIFTRYFGRPGSGDRRVAANYSFTYGNAYFIVMNSLLNFLNVPEQTFWLDRELARAESEGYAFKIVMSHVPMYNPRRHRSNPRGQKYWVPLFDKYNVDLVLNGHDHSYLRSRPLRAGKDAGAGERGTTYVVATAGERFYPMEKLDIAEVQIADVATYQVVTLGVDPEGRRSLLYAAYDSAGVPVDAFEMSKP